MSRPSSPFQVFRVRTLVAATPQELFAFHENPRNLPVVMPPSSRVIHIDCGEHAVEGALVTLEMREMLVIPMRWICRWNKVVEPQLLIDEMVKGPFRHFEHEHHFQPVDGGGSAMTDVVHYTFGKGWWGRLISATGVRLYLTLLFLWRHRQTRRYFSKLVR